MPCGSLRSMLFKELATLGRHIGELVLTVVL
jgi:hypothetical protein